MRGVFSCVQTKLVPRRKMETFFFLSFRELVQVREHVLHRQEETEKDEGERKERKGSSPQES